MAPSLINYQCILRSLCMLTIEDSRLGGYSSVYSRIYCSTGRKWFALHTDCPKRPVCVARVLMKRFSCEEDGAEVCLIVQGLVHLVPRWYCAVSYMMEGRVEGDVLCSRTNNIISQALTYSNCLAIIVQHYGTRTTS
jgi:hypothetical protein